MARKLTLVLAGMALAMMVVGPLAAAHLTNNDGNGSATSNLLTGDACRQEGSGTCSTHNGVSGTYTGYANVLVMSSLFPIPIGPETIDSANQTGHGPITVGVTFCPGSPADVKNYAGATSFCAAYGYSCDAEWLLASPTTADESMVDGAATGGMLTDGTWDDGGQGGACHTNNGPAAWTTYGCDGWYAHGEDAVSGGKMFIAHECDFTTPVSGDTVDGCIINQVILGQDVGALTSQCLPMVTGGLLGGKVTSAATTCGADTAPDASFFGPGNGSGNAGVANPGTGSDSSAVACTDSTDGLADIVALNFVDLNTATNSGVAVGGWLDSTSNNAAPFSY